jgi:glycine oxidase
MELTHESQRADVLVIGDGVIGLSIALGVARSGGTCQVIGKSTAGQASSASAGLLAASLGNADPVFRHFMRSSRDRYPAWLRWLAERTGIEVVLNRLGILETHVGSLVGESVDESESRRLSPDEVRELEPALAAAPAVLHLHDGFADNVTLLHALREALRCEWSVDFVEGRGASIEPFSGGCSVRTDDGRKLQGGTVVLAAGAWSPLVADLPRAVNVEPVRGQMLRFGACPVIHAVSTPDAYLVPRGNDTLVGSTLERVGFDARTTVAAGEHLRRAAIKAIPALADFDVIQAWSGLRPMTPDARPILGRDPDVAGLVYACGHGKNGILLAPLTAECIVDVIAGTRPQFDLTPFSIARFA